MHTCYTFMFKQCSLENNMRNNFNFINVILTQNEQSAMFQVNGYKMVEQQVIAQEVV